MSPCACVLWDVRPQPLHRLCTAQAASRQQQQQQQQRQETVYSTPRGRPVGSLASLGEAIEEVEEEDLEEFPASALVCV